MTFKIIQNAQETRNSHSHIEDMKIEIEKLKARHLDENNIIINEMKNDIKELKTQQ